MNFNESIKYLKQLEADCEIYVPYTHINGIEFEFDILSNLDLNKTIRGYDDNLKELVDVKLGEFNVINSLSFEVQVPCEFEGDFTNSLEDNGLDFVYYETYLAPDCASRDYSVFLVKVIEE